MSELLPHSCVIILDNSSKAQEQFDGAHCKICGKHGYIWRMGKAICAGNDWGFSWDGEPYYTVDENNICKLSHREH